MQFTFNAKPWWEEKLIDAINAYPDWSRAERARMDEITAEILDHVRNGNGNSFVREWCNRCLPVVCSNTLRIKAPSEPAPSSAGLTCPGCDEFIDLHTENWQAGYRTCEACGLTWTE